MSEVKTDPITIEHQCAATKFASKEVNLFLFGICRRAYLHFVAECDLNTNSTLGTIQSPENGPVTRLYLCVNTRLAYFLV